MVDVAQLSLFFNIVAALAFTFAALNYMMLSRSDDKRREAELLMKLYKRWGEPDFLEAWNVVSALEWSDYDDYMSRYGPGANPELEVKRGMVGIYFESMGILLQRGLVDISQIDDMMSGYIIGYWSKYEPVMSEFRKRHNRPEAGEHIEYLYNEVKKVYDVQHSGY